MLIENSPGLSNVAISAFAQQAQTSGKRPGTSESTEQKTPVDRLSNSYNDSVEISDEAKNRSEPTTATDTQISEEEAKQLQELKARDREVRAHEQSHRARGGQYIRGGVQFEYKRGPDGQLYAVGGEVQIDTSEVPDDPEATIRKMRTIRAAALAPGEPSPADRRVAAEATRKEAQARAELQQERAEGTNEAGQTAATSRTEEASTEETQTQAAGGGATARGSIQPFLDNQRVAITPGEYLNIFA